MKRLLILTLVISNLGAYAQNVSIEELDKDVESLLKRVKTLEVKNTQLTQEVRELNDRLSDFEAKTDNLERQTQASISEISRTTDNLGSQITSTEEKTNKQISEVGDSVGKTTLLVMIGLIIAIIVSIIIYLLLRRRQKSDKTDMIEQLSEAKSSIEVDVTSMKTDMLEQMGKTKSSIEENLIREFVKQTRLMTSLTELITQQKELLENEAEPDHSLAIKVVDQIMTMERAISLMSERAKGLQGVKESVAKLKENLVANGYELPELIGKQVQPEMNLVIANSVTDESLTKEDAIITKIIEPQINYNGTMIQAAQVEVRVGA